MAFAKDVGRIRLHLQVLPKLSDLPRAEDYTMDRSLLATGTHPASFLGGPTLTAIWLGDCGHRMEPTTSRTSTFILKAFCVILPVCFGLGQRKRVWLSSMRCRHSLLLAKASARPSKWPFGKEYRFCGMEPAHKLQS